VAAPALKQYGDHALLLELDDGPGVADEVAAWAETLRTADLTGVVDIVPAARTVLIHCADSAVLQGIRRSVDSMQPLLSDTRTTLGSIDVPVTYDGPDLREVSELSGLSVGEVVRAHLDSTWRVAFAGFAPGFAYLVGGDPRLAVSRRPSPRTRVPEGSVAVAAGYSAVYPRSSPGGWRLIGRTDLRVWDLDRQPPALLRPGMRVRFIRADG
jgi:KipI family sensor histidine kinase inhibitor